MTLIALMVASFFWTVSEFSGLREEMKIQFKETAAYLKEIRSDIVLIK